MSMYYGFLVLTACIIKQLCRGHQRSRHSNINRSLIDSQSTLGGVVQQVVDQGGYISNADFTTFVHVSSGAILNGGSTVQQHVDQGGNVGDGHKGVTIHVTQDELRIGRSYPVTNGEGDGIVEEPVPVIVVGEVR